MENCQLCNKEVPAAALHTLYMDPENPNYSIRVCADCYSQGEECQCCHYVYMPGLLGYFVAEGDVFRYCQYCKTDNFFRCEECHGLFFIDNRYQDDRGRDLCQHCYDATRPEQYYEIRPYNFKPATIFHISKTEKKKGAKLFELKKPGNHTFYGLEVETDGYSYDNWTACINSLRKLDEKEREFYCKSDGSLDRGIEIVFHPRTLKSWSEYRDRLKDIFDVCLLYGGKSFYTSTCGCHVHRSNEDLKDWQKTKIISLFVRLKPWIEKTAQRRESTNYASFRYFEDKASNYNWRDKHKGDQKLKLIYKAQKKGDCYNRYVAVNIKNKKTVEYRVFKGSLKIDSVLAYIFFSDSITAFAKSRMFYDLLTIEPLTLWKEYKDFMRKIYKDGFGKDLLEEYFMNKKI